MAAKKVVTLAAVEAASSAFSDIDNLDCVNLMKGRRVEDVVSTGSLVLDLILGGGYARGRIASIFGPEAAGKSTLLQQLVVSAQMLGIPVVYYDPEAGADPIYMRTQGIDLNYSISFRKEKKKITKPGFFYSQPSTGEQVYRHIFGTLDKMPDVDSGPPTIIFLIDSFAAMQSEEYDPKTGDSGRLGSNARMHSHYLGVLSPKLRKKGGLIVGSNQMRMSIGSYGNPEKEAGGNALKYYPDYKMKTRKQWVKGSKEGGVLIDQLKIRMLPLLWSTVKNKSFPPFRSTEMRLILGRGLDYAFDAHYFFQQIGLLEMGGNGRRRLLLKGLQDKTYDWRSFRELTHNPQFRERCFKGLLKNNETYKRYFETSEEQTYFYDAEYDFSETEIEELQASVVDEADEYADDQKTSRKKGKKPAGKSKKKDSADLDLDAKARDEAKSAELAADDAPFSVDSDF